MAQSQEAVMYSGAAKYIYESCIVSVFQDWRSSCTVGFHLLIGKLALTPHTYQEHHPLTYREPSSPEVVLPPVIDSKERHRCSKSTPRQLITAVVHSILRLRIRTSTHTIPSDSTWSLLRPIILTGPLALRNRELYINSSSGPGFPSCHEKEAARSELAVTLASMSSPWHFIQAEETRADHNRSS
jgi:hypothetical protein